ncbi:transmembrane protein 276 [Pelobates fuscus]|uniref:transmembrane protein 276 n=1 Tax=Pelobates fuscus TaxID=191477 RepID=UPI002FE43FB3
MDLNLIVSRVLLCAVCLFSTVRTYQVHRAAAAGFLIHGVGSAYLLCVSSLTAEDGFRNLSTWSAIVTSVPLLAFAFFWLSGDQSTANMLLSAGILGAAALDSLNQEGRFMVSICIMAAASLSILVLSIFTGNWHGVLGSIALGTVALFKAERITIFHKEVASNYGLTAAFLAFDLALRSQQWDYV